MRIFDGFLFHNELDILELRLMELGDLVDVFVLCEFPFDFQMHPKPLFYAENKERFAEWNHKIVHIVPDDIEPASHPHIEHTQRKRILDGFSDADFTDMVLLGDVDEIPSREAIEAIKKTPPADAHVLRMHLYYYRVTNHAGAWNGTVVRPRGLGKIDLQHLRDMRHYLPIYPVPNGGWHFSWMGDVEDIKQKLTAIDVKADDKLYGSGMPKIPDPEEDAEFIERSVLIGDDLFGRESRFNTMIIQPGVLQPRCINDWLRGKEKYGVDFAQT